MGDYNDYLLPEPCLRLDFGFGEQYQSIELGDGTGYLRLRGSEDRETELRERIASLNAENVDIDVDNAKLRELVRDMWFYGYEGHIDSESQEQQMKHIDSVFKRMRELGIEGEMGEPEIGG